MNDIEEIKKEELIAKYEPLVKATARRYAVRGAEFEDLVQEGYLALLILNEKCTDKQWLTAFIASRLPGYERAQRAQTYIIDKMFNCRNASVVSRRPAKTFRPYASFSVTKHNVKNRLYMFCSLASLNKVQKYHFLPIV